jgi:hypothetical protein
MKKIFFVLALVSLSAIFISADVYIQQKVHTDAFEMMGQKTPAKDEIQNMWIGKNKMAVHGDQQSFVVDQEKKQVLFINHANKSYVAMTLPVDLEQYFPPQFMQMMGNISVTITPTGVTETVGKWKCQIYDMKMSMMMVNMSSKIWATKDVPFDWKKYTQDMFSEFAKVTMRLSDDAMKEILKIQGFQVKSEMSVNVMGADMKTTQEVIEITKKNAPAGTYGAPAGYTKKDKLSMMDMQNR